MSHSASIRSSVGSSVRLFTAALPLNMADAIFRLCLDYYRFYYLFTPSTQILRKRADRGEQDGKKKAADFVGYEVLEFAYACGRFFDEEGDMSWISEDGALFCSLCGADIPDSLKGLANWTVSDFTLIRDDEKEHQLLLWNPKKEAQRWLDSQIPRRPAYGVEGTGLPALRIREWH